MTTRRLTSKISNTVSGLISSADIFNDPIYLNMKGRRKMATSLGGLLSGALIIFLLSQGIIQSVSLLRREDPQVYQISELEDDPSRIGLNSSNNFVLAIAISRYSQFVNMSEASPFSFTITYNQYIRYTNGSRTKLKNKISMAPCNRSNFPDETFGDNAFEAYGLNYAYCPVSVIRNLTDGSCPVDVAKDHPDCITPPQFGVAGSYLSTMFEFIQFNLNKCSAKDKLPWGFKCLTSGVAQLLSSAEYKLNLFYANSVVNPMYYEKPNKTYIETIHWGLNPLLSKTADIFVDKEITQDYDSYYSTTEYHNNTFFGIQTDKMRELQVFQTSAGLALLQWNIRRSSVNIVTTRTYQKIQDVMTDLGGFSKAVMFIAAFVAMGYVEYKYQMTLSNEFYDFLVPGDDKAKKRKDAQKNYLKQKGKSQELKDESDTEKKDPVKDTDKVVKEYFVQHRKRREGINFGLMDYVKMVLRWISCRKNKQDELAEKARDLVQEELDIIRVIQKLKEIDKLKVLLLNRYQREVFNFIEKPLVTLENEKPINLDNILPDLSFELGEGKDTDENIPNFGILSAREEYDSLSKYAKLYMTYRYLMEDHQPENQKYNKKLLEMVGDDLIKVFKRVDYVMDENPDPRKFEETIKRIFNDSEDKDLF